MNSTIALLLSTLFSQPLHAWSPPPLPVDKQVLEPYVELVMIGTLTEISTRTFSVTDRTVRPERTEYYDVGTIAVTKVLKGTAFPGITYEALFLSNTVLGGPPLHNPGREAVWLLMQKNHLSRGRYVFFQEWDRSNQPKIESALTQYAMQVDPAGFHNSEECKKIKPGITRKELLAILGKPLSESKVLEGKYRYLSFAASNIAPNKIRARASVKSEKILELDCTGNASDRWHTD